MRIKFRTPKLYLAIDGGNYSKKVLYEGYKHNRKEHGDEYTRLILQVLTTLPHYYAILNDELEADDLAYSFCCDNDHTICISEDHDWLINLTAGEDIRIYQKGITVTRHNFEFHQGYPVDKIPLEQFLRGDSKDGVKKPFRLKGKVLENVSKFKDIEEYVKVNNLDNPDVKTYREVISPIRAKNYTVLCGKKSDKTKEYIRRYRMNFLREYVSKGLL
jgi:hypothetical protein